MAKTSKIYCYVDETGQDSLGRIFIVVTVVVDEEKDEIASRLEKIENRSGKQKRKWINTREAERQKYLQESVYDSKLQGNIYYRVFSGSVEFEDLTVLAIGQTINLYLESKNIVDYKATIVIDGISRAVERRVANSLRKLGVKARKVRGERDESSSLLRFCDSIAGAIRESIENKGDYPKMVNRFAKDKVVWNLQP